jgi:hypothetical protein
MDRNERKKFDSSHLRSLWFITLEAIEDQDIAQTTKIMNVAHQYLGKDKGKKKAVIQCSIS